MTILGISGSLRSDSHNTKLLRAAGELLPEGVELKSWDGLRDVPPYDQDDDAGDAPADVTVATLTRPVEAAVGNVPGVRRMRSRTKRGASEVALSFADGTDMAAALAAVQARYQLEMDFESAERLSREHGLTG